MATASINSVTQQLDALASAAEMTYREMVFDLASGVEISADQILEVLSKSGRTREQFDRHLARATERHAAAARMPELVILRADFDGTEQELAEATEKLNDVRAETRRMIAEAAKPVDALADRKRRLGETIRQLDNEIRNTLRGNGVSPAVEAEVRRLSAKIPGLQAEVRSCQGELDRIDPETFKPIYDEELIRREIERCEFQLARRDQMGEPFIKRTEGELESAKAMLSNLLELRRRIAAAEQGLKENERQRAEAMRRGAGDWRQMDFN